MPAMAALIRRLMSLETNTTGYSGSSRRSCRIAPRIRLSGATAPNDVLSSAGTVVWKRSLPMLAAPRSCSERGRSSTRPVAILSAPCDSISSLMKRLTWRALRADSDIPFLPLSSSSMTCIGRNTSCSSNRNRAVGSCMRTLVSSTYTRLPWVIIGRIASDWRWSGDGRAPPRPAGQGGGAWRDAGGSRVACGLQRVEHGLRVAGDPDPAPFGGQAVGRVDEEGAADHAQHLAAVHVLLVDHVERAAQCLVRVAYQREAEALLGAEVVVRLHRIARGAEHRRAELLELGQQRVEILPLGGATRG